MLNIFQKRILRIIKIIVYFITLNNNNIKVMSNLNIQKHKSIKLYKLNYLILPNKRFLHSKQL